MENMKSGIFIIVLSMVFLSCSKQDEVKKVENNSSTEISINRKDGDMNISSSSFREGELIPSRFTCDGENISPQLKWNAKKGGIKSFALIMNDPDAPSKDFVHWIVYDIPPEVTELPEGASSVNSQLKYHQGRNDFGSLTYNGPCPPSGTHRYIIKIYALDALLNIKEGSGKNELRASISGHIIDEAELTGKYSKE